MVKLKIIYNMQIKCYIDIMFSKKIYQMKYYFSSFIGNEPYSFLEIINISINLCYNKHIQANITYNHNLV